MQLKQLKQKIKEKLESDDKFSDTYNKFLRGYGTPQLEGLEMKKVSSERHNSDWITIFTYDNKYYEIIGNYDSWNGIDFEDSVDDICEVVPEQQVITVYKRV